MKLEYILFNKGYKYKNKIKHLFEHAFPPVERPTFDGLLRFPHHEMYGVEDNNTFIGLIDLIKYNDILYIFFLAIKKTFRGKGYGSKILQDINNKYGKDYRIFLLAENPDELCDNKEERIKRISFYNHNGFILSDIEVIEFEVNYRILYLRELVKKDEFLSTMKYLLGDELFYKYYIHHIR